MLWLGSQWFCEDPLTARGDFEVLAPPRPALLLSPVLFCFSPAPCPSLLLSCSLFLCFFITALCFSLAPCISPCSLLTPFLSRPALFSYINDGCRIPNIMLYDNALLADNFLVKYENKQVYMICNRIRHRPSYWLRKFYQSSCLCEGRWCHCLN